MVAITIFLGAPGAGKGTQAARFCAARGIAHVSTGDLFRENLKNATPIGLEAKKYMDRGELVPDAVVLDMLGARVDAPDCREGYLLDGFPRTLPQAEALAERVGDDDDLRVALIEVSEDTLVRRASGRLLCRTCSQIHHEEFAPPKVEGVCDNDGGELYQRADDAVEVVRERLRVYAKETAPLIRFYQDQGVLRTVDGERSPDEVFQQLDAALPREN